jgi:hypothetical protein
MRHYGVFWVNPGPSKWDHHARGLAMWCRANNRRAAERHARAVRGYVVAVSGGDRMAWDAPTFKVSGTVIYNRTDRPR